MRLSSLILATCFVTSIQGAILRIDIDGPIDPVRAELIRGAVAQASEQDAELLLIRLATPGGLGVSMQEIVQEILNSPVPVVCFVSPQGSHAASAGFFILLAADVAAMAPATNTGAAHPVFPFGIDNPVMLEKVRNDALASLRSIVERRRRSYELAEKGVLESHSYTATEALEGGLIDLIARDEEDLFRQLEGRTVTRPDGETAVLRIGGHTIEAIQMTARQKVLAALANPNLALLLGVFGLACLYLEFQAPGMIVPAVVGSISLILSLLGFSLLPISYIGVILVLLGIGLLVAEALVQGFGVLGIGGSISMVLGLIFLIESPNPDLRIGMGVAVSVGLPAALLSLFFLWTFVRGKQSRVRTGSEGLVGESGVVRSRVDSAGGRVFVRGELWNATSDEEIAPGTRVVVQSVEDLELVVEPKAH